MGVIITILMQNTHDNEQICADSLAAVSLVSVGKRVQQRTDLVFQEMKLVLL